MLPVVFASEYNAWRKSRETNGVTWANLALVIIAIVMSLMIGLKAFDAVTNDGKHKWT